ncbi:MAG: hypothetical protein ACXAEN_17730 [Candidatus Thorarchaeota archaeon]|jgi:hypothetical protein
MAEKSSKDKGLDEKHSAGASLVETLIARMEKKHWSNLDYKRFAHDYIADSDILEEYTNEDRTGYIDLATINGIPLKDDEDFLKEFWQDCLSEFSIYIQSEDQAVRRGALIVDGRVSGRVGDV